MSLGSAAVGSSYPSSCFYLSHSLTLLSPQNLRVIVQFKWEVEVEEVSRAIVSHFTFDDSGVLCVDDDEGEVYQ